MSMYTKSYPAALDGDCSKDCNMFSDPEYPHFSWGYGSLENEDFTDFIYSTQENYKKQTQLEVQMEVESRVESSWDVGALPHLDVYDQSSQNLSLLVSLSSTETKVEIPAPNSSTNKKERPDRCGQKTMPKVIKTAILRTVLSDFMKLSELKKINKVYNINENHWGKLHFVFLQQALSLDGDILERFCTALAMKYDIIAENGRTLYESDQGKLKVYNSQLELVMKLFDGSRHELQSAVQLMNGRTKKNQCIKQIREMLEKVGHA